MYIQPRHLSKMLTGYERLKQKKMEQNLVQLKAAGIKNVPKLLLGLNQSANSKVNDKEEVDIGRAVDGDEDFVLFHGEERLSSNSDNDDPSGSKTNEVNVTGPRKKKACSSAQPLRKSQRTQEQGGSTQGATQAEQLPTPPTEQTDMFCSPHTVKSENFKAMRAKQLELQHTMSRKGYARLSAELKAKRKVASISRVVVWADGHRDKNGKPKNKNVAQKIEDMGKIERNGQNSTNLKEDAVFKVLGAERNGRVRTFGKGVTQIR
ncbi:hypothetical protein RHGRI_013100 [Rhododendron griersonianum]|uniref:Uncharacterized protein n=1 Tax=Rhododendron griersonianum TaxID=479676 RepID=A0AAV6K4N6_9ERIC|nr:hypothetical protein RHGRI_013100 [Rhododendron griersonianum]